LHSPHKVACLAGKACGFSVCGAATIAIGSLSDHPDRHFRQAPRLPRVRKSERACNSQTSTAANSAAYAQTILGSIPEEFRGDWCWQEKANGEEIFRPGACKHKAGSLSIDRMTLDTGRLSCGFDSGTASEGTLNMRMLRTDFEEDQPSMYGAQLKLRSGKKIELVIEPLDQQ
jgi:hypothetical protein